MPLTRAGIENEIVSKLKGRLANRFFTLSVLTNGSNPDLNGPIRRAVRGMGYDTADPLAVVDADLAPFSGWNIEKLIDWARLETLKVCLGQFNDVDVKTDEDEQYLSQFARQVQAEIAYYEKLISEPYGPSINPAATSAMGGSPGIPNDPFWPCRTRSACGNWPYP